MIMTGEIKRETYIPISCNLYDEFEALATLGKQVHIHYDLDQIRTCVEGFIKDFRIRNKVEYMILESGLEIRLDHLISVNDLIMSDWRSC